MLTVDIVLTTELRALCASGEARRIREAARLSRSELARAVGTSCASISRWESGDRRPHGELATAYHRALQQLRQITAKVS